MHVVDDLALERIINRLLASKWVEFPAYSLDEHPGDVLALAELLDHFPRSDERISFEQGVARHIKTFLTEGEAAWERLPEEERALVRRALEYAINYATARSVPDAVQFVFSGKCALIFRLEARCPMLFLGTHVALRPWVVAHVFRGIITTLAPSPGRR